MIGTAKADQYYSQYIVFSLQPSTRRLILPLLHLQTSASSSGGDSWSGLSASPPVTPDLNQVETDGELINNPRIDKRNELINSFPSVLIVSS